MKTEKTITVGAVVDIIRSAQEQERRYCDRFCELNAGRANDERRHDCTIFVNALNTVLYELKALNY